MFLFYIQLDSMTLRGKIVKNEIFGKCLDVGCNSHFLHKEIDNKDMIGLDVVIDQFKERTIKGDAQEVPVKTNIFDCVIAGELIEHLENPALFVKECHRILKRGGKFIITTPNRKSWWNRLIKSYHIKYHKFLFTKNELKDILKKNGFRINKFLFIPFDKYTSVYGKFFEIRRIIHYIMPEALREDMVVVAINQ